MTEPRITIDAEGNQVRGTWFVIPFNGWWKRWECRIEMTWPSGSVDVLWKGHYRSRLKAHERVQSRLAEWFFTETEEQHD